MPCAREVGDGADAVVAIDEVVPWGKRNRDRWVYGVDTESEPVEVLHLVGRIVDDDVLVVTDHLVTGGEVVALELTSPVVTRVEDLLDDKVVDFTLGGRLLLGHAVACTAGREGDED